MTSSGFQGLAIYSLKSNDIVHVLNENWKIKSNHLVKFSSDEKLIIGVQDFGAYNKHSNFQVIYVWQVESGCLRFKFVSFKFEIVSSPSILLV